jgi:hypothetical protein
MVSGNDFLIFGNFNGSGSKRVFLIDKKKNVKAKHY